MTQTFPSEYNDPQNAPPSAHHLAALALGDLVQLCTQELHHLLASRMQPDDFHDAFALELFRRAAGGDVDAWTCIFQQYSLLVTTWLLQFVEAAPVIERGGAPPSSMPLSYNSHRRSRRTGCGGGLITARSCAT